MGTFRLNAIAVQATQFLTGSKLALAQDKSEQWYLFESPKGFNARMGKGGELLFNNVAAARRFLATLKMDSQKMVRFALAKEAIDVNGVVYWPIITRNVLASK